MQTNLDVQFKTLLTVEEYKKLTEKFKGNRTDYQTNHYFDTARFSLKAVGASLRVRERESLELTFKRKKGYLVQEITIPVTNEILTQIRETGSAPEGDIRNELAAIVGDQKLINFLSLSTNRMFFPYKNGALFIDESTYLGVTDYELEYVGKNYNESKRNFLSIINELEIQYKRADKKIKRAFNAYKWLN